MVQANSLWKDTDILNLMSLANSKSTVPHRPFLVASFNPRREVNDRGGFVFGDTYNFGDQVSYNGYLFIAFSDGITAYPLDPTTNDPNGGWLQPWQSCYQRLRDAVKEAVDDPFLGLSAWKQAISGSWPCQNPNIDYQDLEFYFADTGSSENVVITGEGIVQAVGTASQVQTELPIALDSSGPNLFPQDDTTPGANPDIVDALAGPPGQYNFIYNPATEITIVIGGTVPITVNAQFEIQVGAFRGLSVREDGSGPDGLLNTTFTQDGTDPLSLLTVDTSEWISGATFSTSFGGWNAFLGSGDFSVYAGTISVVCTLSGTVSPGTYKVKLTSSGNPNNRASGTLTFTDNGDGTETISGDNTWAYDTFLNVDNGMTIANGRDIHGSLINATISYTATGGTEVPGIHDTKKVFKIALPEFDASLIPSGLYVGATLYRNNDPSQTFPFTLDQIGTYSAAQPYRITETSPYTVILDGVTSSVPGIDFSFARQTVQNGIRFSTFTPSTTGFWFGKTPPVSSLGLRPYDKMPWNIFPTTQVGTGAGTAVPNQFLGYSPPYIHGTNVDGSPASQAYVNDGPAWIPTSANNEMLPWPKRWKPNVTYPANYSIMDSFGNLQTCDGGRSGSTEPMWTQNLGDTIREPDFIGTHRQPGALWRLTKILRHVPTILRNSKYGLGDTEYDDNGNLQTVTTAGTTAILTPTWNITLSGTTTDGTVVWTLTNIYEPINPAVAKITPVVYPSFWQNPAAGQTDPPPILVNSPQDSGGHFIFSFAPQGWWIYRVALNRIPQIKTTAKPPSDPISVTLGCIRNGAFVAFGTYNSGQIIDAYWPIFTNTALCYRASERIDVQAAIVICGLGYGTWGNVDYPFAATYLNDIETVLNLLP